MNASKAIITKVHVQGYRSLEDVVVELNPLTVLVGPNGSGKSSFADVFVFLQECLISSPDVALDKRGGSLQALVQVSAPIESRCESKLSRTLREAIRLSLSSRKKAFRFHKKSVKSTTGIRQYATW